MDRGGRPDFAWPAAARLLRLAVASLCVLSMAGGCSMFRGGGSKPETTAATTPAAAPAAEGEIDVRRYIGPDYCPELRVLNGAELVRSYERGHDDEPNYVIWQASVGKTARECLFDLQGGLTLRIGVSGRVISGPKGGASTVSVPLKIAVVKHKEAVLATENYSLDVAIPPQGSTTFTQVKEILVPSPGRDRDYIIYVGFDTGDWDPLNGEAAKIAAVPEEEVVEEEEVPPTPPPPSSPPTPSVLPVPDGGFVLPQ